MVDSFFPDGEENEERMLLILFCHLCVNNGDDNIRFHDLDFLFDDKREWNRQKVRLNNGNHFLIEEHLIEYNNDNGMIHTGVIKEYPADFMDEAILKYAKINLSNII